jgi:hypothetical protein
MTRYRRSGQSVLIAAVMTILAQEARTQVGFLDDFSDGRINDASPITWRGFNAGDAPRVENGDLIVSTDSLGQAADAINDRGFGDTSIRAQGRIIEGDYLSVFSRVALSPSYRSYGAAVGADGSVDVYDYASGRTFFTSRTNLNPVNLDVVLQLDVIGNTLSFWAWQAGQPMPSQPLFRGQDPLNRSTFGFTGVSTGWGDLRFAKSSGVFRYVHVATSSIPEPASYVLVLIGLASGILSRSRRIMARFHSPASGR